MRRFPRAVVLLVLLLPFSLASRPTRGDSIYGRITAVRRADLAVFAHAVGTYTVRIAGIAVPTDTRSSDSATAFLRNMVLNHNVRIRMEGGRLRTGELNVRLFTADTSVGIRDVAVEMVRAGMVRRLPNYDYKYGELAVAEAEARQARRGLWRPR